MVLLDFASNFNSAYQRFKIEIRRGRTDKNNFISYLSNAWAHQTAADNSDIFNDHINRRWGKVSSSI